MIKTVVIWKDGANVVRPVGPTSQDTQLLKATRANARARYGNAEIVPWDLRAASVAQVKAWLKMQEA